jgi:hypothetical protein
MSYYLDPNKAVDRLRKEWEIHGGLIIAVDVDSTLIPYQQHEWDADFTAIHNLIKGCKTYGCTIIIFTAAAEERHENMKQAIAKLGIEWDYFNESPPYIKEVGKTGKVYANVFLDDRAGLCETFNALSFLLAERRAILATRQADLLLQKFG